MVCLDRVFQLLREPVQRDQQQRQRERVKDDFHDVADRRVEQQGLGSWNVDVFGKARYEEIRAGLPDAKDRGDDCSKPHAS